MEIVFIKNLSYIYFDLKHNWLFFTTVPVEEKNRLIQKEGLALLAYVQSDCDAPSHRDHLVEMLQRHIAVDCYGQCLHNKDLPEQWVFVCVLMHQMCTVIKIQYTSNVTCRGGRIMWLQKWDVVKQTNCMLGFMCAM